MVLGMMLFFGRRRGLRFAMRRDADEAVKESDHSGFQFSGGVRSPRLESLMQRSGERFLSVGNYFVEGPHTSLPGFAEIFMQYCGRCGAPLKNQIGIFGLRRSRSLFLRIPRA